MEIEEGDIVLCTVDRIIGTTVFVKIDSSEKRNEEATIVTSEIAPGRIRNLRDYVVPKKKIVCKVLKISGNQIHLSLRRVTQKEKKELLVQISIEKNYESMLKTVLGEKAEKIISEIKQKTTLGEFMNNAKNDPSRLEKLAGKKESEKIIEILRNQKQKTASSKKEIELTTTSPEGLKLIKEVLEKAKDIEIRYISSGKYSLKKESNDIKTADNQLKETISEMEKEAKKRNINLIVKEK